MAGASREANKQSQSQNRTNRGGGQRYGRGKNQGRGRKPFKKKEDELDRKVISIRRVAKVRSGAKRLRFSALVAVGDRKGNVGIGLGRGGDTKSAISKAERYASSHMTGIDLIGDTIPHEMYMKYGAAKVVIKPAGPGTGVIASAPIRAVMEVAGIRNILTKQLGSDNDITNTYCVYEALKSLDKKRILEKKSRNLKSKSSKEKSGTSRSKAKKK